MADIACFMRNRSTTVEQPDDQSFRSTCRIQDTLLEAWVEILVKTPDLEIIEARGEIIRSRDHTCLDVTETLQPILGSRVGPGIKKIVRGFLKDAPCGEALASLLDECCNGIIMSFTKEVLRQAPKDAIGEKAYFTAMVKANPRMYNSCAALSQESPLLEGLDLKES